MTQTKRAFLIQYNCFVPVNLTCSSLFKHTLVMDLHSWSQWGPVSVLSIDNRWTVWGHTDHCDLKLWHIRQWAKKLWTPLAEAHEICSCTVDISQCYDGCEFRGLCKLQIWNSNSLKFLNHFLLVLRTVSQLLLVCYFVCAWWTVLQQLIEQFLNS